jgi:deoxyguanosine kinase
VDTFLDPYDQNPFLTTVATPPTEAEALRLELTFVALRVAQLREIAARLAAARPVVADWALVKQVAFAATTLGAADVSRMAATVDAWAGSVPVPDLLVGLTAPPEALRARIRRRARGFEDGLTCATLSELSATFDAVFAGWPGRLLMVDTTVFDVFDDRHLRQLAEQVRRLLAPATPR